jgi:hypothetical protein
MNDITIDYLKDLRFTMMSAAYSDDASVYTRAKDTYNHAVEMSRFDNKAVTEAFYA